MRRSGDKLFSDIDRYGIEIFDCPTKQNAAIASPDGCIGLNPAFVETESEWRTILCHELGHFISGAFYLGYSPYELREQAEYRAERAAIMRYLPYEELLACMRAGMTEPAELAEYFSVTEEAVRRACLWYRECMARRFGEDEDDCAAE